MKLFILGLIFSTTQVLAADNNEEPSPFTFQGDVELSYGSTSSPSGQNGAQSGVKAEIIFLTPEQFDKFGGFSGTWLPITLEWRSDPGTNNFRMNSEVTI